MVTQDSLLYLFALVNDNFLTDSNLLVTSDDNEFNKLYIITNENLLKCNKMLNSIKKKDLESISHYNGETFVKNWSIYSQTLQLSQSHVLALDYWYSN